MKQLHAYFRGRVQGVFFRQTAKKIADKLELTGFVKNLPDDRVELLAEGKEENLQKLLDELSHNFEINDTQISWADATKNYSTFEILF